MANNSEASVRWEQHVGTISNAVIVALLIWTGTSLIALREQLAVMKVEVVALQTLLGRASADNYSAAEAERAQKAVQIEVDRLEKRIERIERGGGR